MKDLNTIGVRHKISVTNFASALNYAITFLNVYKERYESIKLTWTALLQYFASFFREKASSVKRPASPEEEEDTSSERKDHLASATSRKQNHDKNSEGGKQDEPSASKKQNDSAIGAKVVCHIRGKTTSLKGVLKWVGYLPTLPKTNTNIVAGIELIKEDKLGTDGSFMGKRYFTASPKRGYFVRYKDCKKVV